MKTAKEIKITVTAKGGKFIAESAEGYAFPGRYSSMRFSHEEMGGCGTGWFGGYTLATSETGDSPQSAHDALRETLTKHEGMTRVWNDAIESRINAAREFNERGFGEQLLALYRAGKLFINDGSGVKKLSL